LTGRIFLKLTGVLLCVLLVAMIAVDLLVSRIAAANYVKSLTGELTDQARLLAGIYAASPDLVDRTFRDTARAARTRLTIIAADGTVVADSEAEPAGMENHARRPEVQEALAGREGASIRWSATIRTDFLYVAVPLSGRALRLAVPLSEVDEQVGAIRRQTLAAVALAFLPAVLLAAVFARHVSRKLARVIDYSAELAHGNFQARLGPIGRGELGVLGRKLSETGQNLQKMFTAVEREHAELEKAERIRKDFVINVSHELRTPLASIQGYAETLLDGAIDDPDNNVRFLEIIRKSAERLTRLTADLITLSQVEMKTRELRCSLQDVAVILQDAVDAIQPVAAKKNIGISAETPAEQILAFCDAEAVFQVLSNLIENAVKYTPEGGAITAGVGRTAGCAEIWVRDTGIGIPPEELPRLFERFYRVDKARSRELGGTGLGLAIAKHLVRSQGGEIRVESELGRGSVFTFTLPASQKAPQLHPELTVS
jgi:two-component system phosphate regulon sensor histidine kinase PhoR